MTRFTNKETVLMQTRKTAAAVVMVATTVYIATFALVTVRAQTVKTPRVPLTSLKGLAVPEPPNLAEFVQNRQAAIALGKALFWDMQSSSDNILACASCHFHAGADNRVKNELDPDLNNVTPDTRFNPTAAANKGGPNYTLKAADFPFHQLQNPADRNSAVTFDTNDVVGSAGVFNSQFVQNLGMLERNRYYPDGIFQVGTAQTRRVTPRNTPSNINAVLNFRNFWDGRANFVFNGVTPFGPRDTSAQIWVTDLNPDPKTGVLVQRAVPAHVAIPYASAASQSVGPILSAFEMAGAGRVFAEIGHKLLSSPRPLLYQQVSATDSVLGTYRTAIGFGLNTTYEAMIKQAFQSDYWEVPDAIFYASSGQTTYRQIEMNFSLFWGLAIQMYESTLISDDSPFDQYAAGNQAALTPQQQHGLAIFSSERGRCVNCHKGPEFTGASTRMVLGDGFDSFGGDGPIEHMLMGDKTEAIYDNGFYNIGVVPAANDVGVGGSDPFGNPLSFAREYKQMLAGRPAIGTDAMSHSLDPCSFQSFDGCTVINDPNQREAVDGSFKAPSLRNVELTGPYFHNGGYATLEQVVDFYSRGGNVRTTATGDTSGLGPHPSNLDTEIYQLSLTDDEKADLVAFLKSLTDERVRWEKAPFDHPSLAIPHGAIGDNATVTSVLGFAIDQFLMIPAVGAAGLSSPIKAFSPQ